MDHQEILRPNNTALERMDLDMACKPLISLSTGFHTLPDPRTSLLFCLLCWFSSCLHDLSLFSYLLSWGYHFCFYNTTTIWSLPKFTFSDNFSLSFRTKIEISYLLVLGGKSLFGYGFHLKLNASPMATQEWNPSRFPHLGQCRAAQASSLWNFFEVFPFLIGLLTLPL